MQTVYAKCLGDGKSRRTVNEQPVKPGDIVAVDPITFRNLSKKGHLTEATKEEIAAHLAPVKEEKKGGK